MSMDIDQTPTHVALLPVAWVRKRAAAPFPAVVARPRAAGYARYSDDRQNETSIERQEEDNARYIESQGWELVKTYSDRAQSGAHTAGRDGLLAVLKDAEHGMFDKLVAEDIDRLGRDLGILGSVHRQLTDAGIEIHATRQGRQMDPADVAFRGLQAQETRTLLTFRTVKGREKASREGRAEVVWYGFVRSGQRGRRKRVPELIQIVEWIYAMRLDGLSFGAIRDVLNERGIPSPRGKTWTSTAVWKLVANPRYKGVQVTRRTKCTKPFNRRRIVKPRPAVEWIVVGVPEWRVVSDETWELAQPHAEESADEAAHEPPAKRQRAPRSEFLLTGRVSCPGCGGTMMITRRRESRVLVCSGSHHDRVCKHRTRYPLAVVEREVLVLIRGQLADPRLEREYVTSYEEERLRLARQADEESERYTRRLAELDRFTKASFMESLVTGCAPESVADMRRSWHAESEAIQVRLAGLRRPARASLLAPERLAGLREAFDTVLGEPPFAPVDETGRRLVSAFHKLVSGVSIRPDGIGRGFHVSVETRLPAMLGADRTASGPMPTLVSQGRWQPGRTWTKMTDGDAARLDALARSGTLDMDDRTWELVRPLVADTVARRRAKPPLENPRLVVDGMLFLLRTGAPFHNPPARYGAPAMLRSAFARLLTSGCWDRMVTTLNERIPGFLDDVDLPEAERIRLQWVDYRKRRKA